MNYQHNAIINTLPPIGDASIWGDDVALVGECLPHLLKYNDLKKFDHTEAVDGFFQGAGIIMHNPQGQQNLVVYNDEHKPHLAFAYESHAIVLGDIKNPAIAVLGIDNAIALYKERMQNSNGACVLTLPQALDYYFVKMIKAFSPKYAFTTDNKPIDGVDCTVVSYHTPLATALHDKSFDDILGDGYATIEREPWGIIAPLDKRSTPTNRYPTQAFGKLACVVEAISDYTQTPSSMAGQAVLGALSTICQCLVNAPMGYEHKPVSLFLLTESPSGAGKTQVNRLAYQAIYEYEKIRYQQFVEDMHNYQSNKSNLKGKERAEFFASSVEPINKAMIIKDGSIEKILDRFVKADVQNQSWATDEAGLFFGGYSMKADTNANALSSFTDLWSAGTVNRQRMSNKTPYTNAHDCRFTLDLAGQRVVLEPAINDDLMNGQGFLARCLFSCEPSLIGNRDWLSEKDPAKDIHLIAYWERCNALLQQLPYHPSRFNMPFAKGAKQHLAQYQQQIEHQQQKGARLADLTAYASRMAENATRIATILAYYDNQSMLSSEYLERAYLLVEFSINERLYYNDKGDAPTHAEQMLVYLTKKHTDGVLLYSNVQMNISPKALRKKEAFELAIDVLVQTNHIKVKEKHGKRYIMLNPVLY